MAAALAVLGLAACTGTDSNVPPPAPAADAQLLHRYSFMNGAQDSAGKIDGLLKGSAKVQNGKLILDNGTKGSPDETLAYLEFASSVLPKSGSVSIVFWFSAQDTQAFARIVDFGDREGTEGRAFIYFSPRIDSDLARAATSATDTSAKTFIDTDKLDDGKTHMVALVISDQDKKLHLYVDGKEPVAAEDLGENTLDKVRPTHCWLGRSAFDNDGGMSAVIDEVRVYGVALSKDAAAALAAAGPDKLVPAK